MQEKIKFGTDGWRAIIGKDFTLKNVTVVAQAIADYIKRYTTYDIRHTKVVVGYDRRKLSPESAKRMTEVLTANGVRVVLSDRDLPTQAVSFAVKDLKCVVGIMVTASHNPASFNGIKIKGSFGGSAEKEVTNRVEKLLFKNEPKKISLSEAQNKKLLKKTNLITSYLKFLRSYLNMPLLKKAGLKILVDPMYGTGNSYIAEILKNTNCRVTTIHTKRDSSFGGNKPEPIKICLKEAANIIKAKHFDIGLATDGDADRIAALDERGKFIDPQQIISLLLLHLIRNRKLKGAVVQTISGSVFVDNIAKKHKLKVYETPIGFKYISSLMQKKDILIGGEEAGGIGFKNYIPERDGILAGLLLIEMIAIHNKSFSELLQDMAEEFGSHVYLRRDIKCKASHKLSIRVKLNKMRTRKRFLDAKIVKTKDYDGLRFCLSCGGWILFRLSDTEPLLRIYAEASSAKRTQKLIQEGVRIIG